VKTLSDTSVLVAAMIESHPAHLKAFSWLQQVKNSLIIGYVSAHSIAEQILTLNSKDFLRIYPELSDKIVAV
jgi:predicted nucleic acid-binding protein